MQFQIYAPDQLLVFAKALLLGASLGLFYDVFRILRIAIKSHSIIIFFEDILFFVLAAILTFLFIFNVNSGVVRWFIFLGIIVGFALYYITVGKLVIKISEIIINIFKSIFKFLWGLLIKPFVMFFKWIYRKIRPFCIKIKDKTKIVHNNLRNGLKSRRSMVYNLGRKKMQKLRGNKGHNKGLNKSYDKKKRKKI